MKLNRDLKNLFLLLILIGFILSLIIYLSLFSKSIDIDDDDDVIPQHYNLEFIDHMDHLICHMKIFFQLTKSPYEFLLIKSMENILSINLYEKDISIPIEYQINNHDIIIKRNQWKKRFSIGNYSLSMSIYINISNIFKTNFIRQIWSSKYRILFPNKYPFVPYFPHSFYQSTFNINIISSEQIISNIPLNQITSQYHISHIAFTLLSQYECRSIDILQICLPILDNDLFSHIFNYTLNTIQIYETYFSRKLPLENLTLIAVLEINEKIILKSGLIFLDQNIFLSNHSAEEILQQRELIFFILAYQWIDKLIEFNNDNKWFGISLAKSISNELFIKSNDPSENHNHIEKFMSTIIIDSLCNISENNSIEKGEAYLNEYRLNIGDIKFQKLIQELIQHSLNLSIIYNDFISSTISDYSFKFNSNCSAFIPSKINDSINPFIHTNYSFVISSYQQFNSKILFDSFLFNLNNQISIEYPLQMINHFFQQSTLNKNDLLVVRKILHWYRPTLKDKFENFLRKILNPFCINHLWTRQNSLNQQIINDILLELCCEINHSICLQHISNRNDPNILIQSIFNTNYQKFDSPSIKSTEIDMLTSYNQLQIPSLFIYPDRIITNIVCQTVRQQNDKYWYDLIHSIQQKISSQLLPSSILTGLSCSIHTFEQLDYYLNNLCPSSPFKWPCYKNLLQYSSMKNFEQLKTIDIEQWPTNHNELVDFLFHISTIQSNFSSYSIVYEFQLLIQTWLTNNQNEFLHWLDNEIL